MSDEFDDRVIDIVASATSADPIEFSAATGPDDIELWDSFAQLNIMVAIEDEFGVQLDPEDAEQMMSIGAISELVRSRLA